MAKEQSRELPGKRPGGARVIPLSLVLVFILLLLAGGFTFIQLDKIVQSINTGIQPDRRQIITRNIINHLRNAENGVKSFSLTQNEAYLSNFYQSVKQTEEDLRELHNNLQAGDSVEIYFDSLQQLVETKFILLDHLLEIQDEYRVQQAVIKITESLQEDSLRFLEQEEEGFFNRLFKGKKKQAEEAAERQEKIEELTQEVEEQKEEEIAREERIRREELSLIRQDREIMQQISSLLSWFDSKAIRNIEERTLRIGKNIAQIRRSIGFFVILGAVLLMIAIFTIVRFVRSNKRYNAAMQQAREEAENLAGSRERFLANMSHEIRTPMNVISGFTNQLLKGDLSPAQREQLGMIKNSADHLVHILNDVLDFSKLEAGKLSLNKKAFRLHELLNEIVFLFRPSAEEKGLELKTVIPPEVPEIVKGDPVRLRQILVNLIGNAIKFTSEGHVHLICSTEAGHNKNDKTQLTFTVEDTGMGIPGKDLEKIFEEFEQSDSTQKQHAPGTGLGLAITKMLTDLFGGSVDISSKEGEGTSISVNLPFENAAASDLEPIAVEETGYRLPENLNILVVDDEEYNRRLLSVMLHDHNIQLIEAASAEEALQLLHQLKVDIVLSDIRLPGMNGMELTAEIRKMKEKEKSAVPVIALTASVTEKDRKNFRDAGMDGFLPKPVPEADLIKMIAKHVKTEEKRSTPKREKQQKEQPVYDLAPLKRLSTDSNGFYREMIELFIKNGRNGFRELELLIDKKDWEKVKEQAHKIVSPARHLKASRLIAYLKAIEGMDQGNQPEKYSRKYLELAREEFENIIRDIKQQEKS